MNSNIFNACLALGWLLTVAGVTGLHSIAAGLLAGGVLLLAITILLARWAGVKAPTPSCWRAGRA
jgi:hypothetical protein